MAKTSGFTSDSNLRKKTYFSALCVLSKLLNELDKKRFSLLSSYKVMKWKRLCIYSQEHCSDNQVHLLLSQQILPMARLTYSSSSWFSLSSSVSRADTIPVSKHLSLKGAASIIPQNKKEKGNNLLFWGFLT